jgi:hypothetical protein
MTEKANPSANRAAEAFKTAGAIAYGGSREGFISESAHPTEISVQDPEIIESNLNAFEETNSTTSLDVTIDGGEAFVFGSWIAIDTPTTVTLPASSTTTVFVGWNKDGTDDVIIGPPSAFSSASGDADQKIPLYEYVTDSTGVTSVADQRDFIQIDADTLNGKTATEISVDISDSGSTVVNDVIDINFGNNISVTDDGDGSVTISGAAEYTDSDAISAVNSETQLTVNITGDADTVDGFEIQKNGTDGGGIINFKTS